MPPCEIPLLRERAAQLLDAPASDSFAQARAAFLGRLPRVDHLPPEDWCTGLALLDDTGRLEKWPFATQAVERTRRQLLRDQVDAFAADYWTCPPEERATRWKALAKACEREPALSTYLQCLAPGLQVSVDQFDGFEGKAAELALQIKEQFTMHPPRQAARLREWLTIAANPPGLWMNAAIRLRERAPAVANLDPVLMQMLASRAEERVVRRPVRYEPNPGVGNRGLWVVAVIFIVMFISILSTSRRDPIVSTPPVKNQQYPWQNEEQGPAQKAVLEALRAKKAFPLKPPAKDMKSPAPGEQKLGPNPPNFKVDPAPPPGPPSQPGARP